MKLRVAFVMGGGVSLGTFCGGALGEAIRVLWDWDREAEHSVEIDVCAGASAGAISLALMLRTLANPDAATAALRNADPAADPGSRVKALQYHAWVEQVGIEALAGTEPHGGWRSLLDRSVLDRLSRQLLAWRPQQPAEPDLLAPRLLLHNTLTSLNGLPYDAVASWIGAGHTVEGATHALAEALSTAAFKDRRIFDLRSSSAGGSERYPHSLLFALTDPLAWEEIAGTALACGAFPLAFEPVVLERRRSEYPELQRQAFGADDSALFSYCDGGVVENDPMGDALDLCRAIDEADSLGTDEERLIVYVDPNVGGSRGDRSLALHRDDDFVPGAPPKPGFLGALLGSGGRVVAAVAGQAQHESEDRIRFTPGLHDRYTVVGIGPLEPGLEAPEGFDPEPVLLWGAAGANFAGFLDRRYRRYDFGVGERHAYRTLRRYLESRGEPTRLAEPEWDERIPKKRPGKPKGAAVFASRINRAISDAIPMSTTLLFGPLVAVARPIGLQALVTRAWGVPQMVDQDEKEIASIPVRLRIAVDGLPNKGGCFFHLDGELKQRLKVRGGETRFETTVEVRHLRGYKVRTRGAGVVTTRSKSHLRIVWRRNPPKSGRAGRKLGECDIALSEIDWKLARHVDSLGKGVLVGAATWKEGKRVPTRLQAEDELRAWRFPEAAATG